MSRSRHGLLAGPARLVALFVAVLVACCGVAVLAAPSAAAAPAVPAPTVQLPASFPASLKQFIGGTPEFAGAPWMTGACKDQGGDVGAYVNAVEPVESRLLFWLMPADQRVAFWQQLISNGQVNDSGGDYSTLEPPPSVLPATFPGGDTNPAYQYPSTCADSIQHWAPAAANTFGFTWAPKIDGSLATNSPAAFASSIDQANDACSDSGSVYCAKAFFVDCSTASPAEVNKCWAWNRVAVNNQAGLRSWVSGNTSTWDKVKNVLGVLGAASFAGGKAVASAFSGIASTFGDIAAFVADPSSELDKLANEVKKDAISLTQSVLTGYNRVSTWDLTQGNFLSRYAKVAALGWLLLAVMFLGAVRRAKDSGDDHEFGRIMQRLVISAMLMTFAPLFASLAVSSATTLTQTITDNFTSTEVGTALTRLGALASVTSAAVPGGVIVGILLFGLILLGACGLFLGLMVERFGMEIGTVMFALVAGLYVHPRWKNRVSKLGFTITGLIFAKPLVLLVVGVSMGIVADNLSASTLSSGGFGLLGGMVLAAIGLVFTGLAPFALLKWAPVLPTDGGSHDKSSAGMMTGAVLGAGSSAITQAARKSGSSGSSGGGRGAPVPAATTGGAGSGADGGGQAGWLSQAARAKSEQSAGRGSTPPRQGPPPVPTQTLGAGSSAGGAGATAGGGAAASGAGGAAAAAGPAGIAVSAAASIGKAAAGKAKHAANRQMPTVDVPEDDR